MKTEARLGEQRHLKSKNMPIPTPLMLGFIKIMQAWLKEKRIGYKRELLRDLLKEVRVEVIKSPLEHQPTARGGKRAQEVVL